MKDWDAGLAASVFSMNIELDEPIERREEALERLRRDHGPLLPDPVLPAELDSPLHEQWWLVDAHGGRVKVEIRLSPEPAQRIQTFFVTSIPAPDPELSAIAAASGPGDERRRPGHAARTRPRPGRRPHRARQGPAHRRGAPRPAARSGPLSPATGGQPPPGASPAHTERSSWRSPGTRATSLVTALSLLPRPLPPATHAD